MNDQSGVQKQQLSEIARRLASLEPAKQQAFLTQLAAKGIDLSILPIARQQLQRAPLSFAQSRLWFLWRMDPGSSAYNMPVSIRLRGRLDIDALQRALDRLVVRHASLRTVFRQDGGEPEQIVCAPQPVALRRIIFGGEDREQQAARVRRDEAAQPFDLESGPLLRAALLELGDQDHILTVTLHHIVADGWSLQVLTDEFWQLYHCELRGEAHALPALDVDYGDFAAWQRLCMGASEGERQLRYWTNRLRDTTMLQLPLDRARAAEPDQSGDVVRLSLGSPLADRLRALAQRHQTTIFVVLLAGLKLLLHRYSGQSDICVGVPIANRDRSETRRLIGLLVNTQVLRTQIDTQRTIADFIAALREVTIEAQEHQDLPFERLLDALQPQRSLSQNPLFQVLYNHQRRRDPSHGPAAAELRIEAIAPEIETVKFDLALDTEELPSGDVSAVFSFATALFNRSTIDRLACDWRAILDTMAENCIRPIATLDLLSARQRDDIRRWNEGTRASGPFVPVHSMFARHAEERPAAPALVFGTETISYEALNRRANAMARYLLAQGVRPGDVVAISMQRSPALVAAFTAVLKAGAAYLPLDPDHPPARQSATVRDGGAKVVLVAATDDQGPAMPGVNVLDVGALSGEGSDIDPAIDVHPQSLAYVIYTSGSTGLPKGVAVAHGPFAGHCAATAELYEMDRQSRELHFLSFTFDGAHERLWTALCCGAALVMRGADLWSAEQTLEVMRAQNVTNAGFPPAYLQQLAEFAAWRGDPPPVSLYSFGGEAMPKSGFDKVRQALRPRKLINGYGPTETVVTPLVWKVDADADIDCAYAPIGRPVGQRSAYILDGDLNVVPVGVTAELYVGGEGLATGYRNRPGLTAERFIPDPHGEPGARLYRTGDLARWREDGVIDYVGRSDHQLKIRGFRIEPGEIEARLIQQSGVRSAVVVAHELGGRQQLVGYVCGEGELEEARLRAALLAELPDYMVPARIVSVAQMPVTAHGKIDRDALPLPTVPAADTNYVAPQTSTESTLAAIWSEMLGQARVGLHDNFFELGGDSIISLQVVGRARQRGLSIEPRDLFRHQTLEQLARVARSEQAPDLAKQTTEPDQGPVPLLPIQRRFFVEEAGERHHWNQAVLLKPNARLDWAAMARAVAAVVAQHDALRVRFAEADGEWQAEYGEAPLSTDLLWTRSVADAAEITRLATAAQASLSLQGPLLRLVGMDMKDGSQRLLIVLHHLVVDGVSWRILLEDLASAYGQAAQGVMAIALPPKSESVRSWGQRLADYAATAELAGQLDYWSTRSVAVDLPCDDDHGDIDRVADGEDVVIAFDAELTAKLLKDAPAAYRTQVNDLLLAALARAVGRWSGLDDILVELEGHGREDLFNGVDLSRTVGWFTTAFPVCLSGCASDDATLIKATKEQLRAIPARGLGYGVLRYCGSPAQREALASVAEPRIVFNYLGQFGSSLGAESAFSLAPESAGPARSASAPLGRWLSINGQVLDRELRLTFSFGRRRYRRATIERLAACYSLALRELVAHCTSGAHGITPSDVPLSRLSQSELDLLGVSHDWRRIEDIYPLSPMQQGMLFHALRDAESGSYVSQIAVDISGAHGSSLQAAWQAVTARHAVLRTAFVWRELSGAPQQVVYRQIAVPFVVEDWRDRVAGMDAAARDSALAAAAHEERQAGFDLSRPPLQRVRLIDLGGGVHRLIWTHHHILLDGWSAARLIAEIMQQARGVSLTAVRGRYRDYIAWLLRQDQDASSAFWSQLLSRLEEPTLLGDALGAPEPAATGHASIDLVIDAARTERLQALARRERVTLNTVLQGAWAQLLRRLTGQQAVCFGATMSGRPPEIAAVDEIVGLFINTVPVLDDTSPKTLVGDWLRSLQDRNVDLREHGWMPLYEIQRLAGRAGRALFDTIFVFENYPVDDVLRDHSGDGPRASRAEQISITNYPLTIAVFVTDASIRLGFRYDRSRFDRSQIEWLQAALACLLARMTDASTRPLADLHGLDDASVRRVLGWSAGPVGQAPHDEFDDVIAQFERQAAMARAAIALVTENERISYAELNRRANRLARQLRARGVDLDVPVGLAFERGIDMIVAVLAVLKAGAGYLPLDPDYPSQRLAMMLRDSGARLVLTMSALHDRFSAVSAEVDADLIVTDAADDDRPAESDGFDLSMPVHPESLAYVIYTSGSTGVPKGVGCTRGALAARLAWMQAEYQLAPSETLLQKTPFSFDVAVWEMLWPLTSGARLAIAPPGAHREPRRLIDAVVAHGVTTLHFVPQMLAQFIAEPDVARCTSLTRLFSGGEALPVQLMDEVRAVFPSVRFDNRYGPTETLINATFWTCGRQSGRRVPIGHPIPGTILRILDADLNLVDEGTTGELYIGGVGLARGYLGRAALTAERFIADPFGQPGERLYRTGDLARWRSDGAIDYVGRVDHQVKVRGFRIELGEIEACLLQQPAVSAAAVVARAFGAGHQLVGYVSGSGALDGAALREALAARLPDYMVPSRIVVLDRLPLMVNGKVDRAALPAPELETTAGRIAPRTPNEAKLAAIWAELLRAPDVGVTDNFFELGGDSIISLQMVSRARRAGLVIEPRDVFKHQTLEALAREARLELRSVTQAEQGPIIGAHPLLPIQLRFFEQELETPDHWNQALLLQSRQRLNWTALERAVEAVVAHHDALRLRFERDESVWRAEHDRSGRTDLFSACEVADADAVTALAAEVQASLSLARGPLLRVVGMDLPGEQRLLIVVHHLVVDGVSWRVLLEDLAASYEQLVRADDGVALPLKTHAYAQWGAALHAYAGSDELAAELPYWTAIKPREDLPCDDDHAGRDTVADAHEVTLEIEAGLTTPLLGPAHAAYRTQVNDLLLSALSRALWQWSGCADVVIELEGHGREDIGAGLDLSRTVGWFTTAFPVRLVHGGLDPASLIKATKETLRGVPHRGLGYGLLRYLGSDSQRKVLAARGEPRIGFNYLGQLDDGTDEAALFTMASESAGPSRAASSPLRHHLAINARVQGGRLQVSFGFSRKRYRTATVDRLADGFKAALEELLDHCAGDVRGVTPSDVPLSKLTQDELDALALDWREVEDVYPLSPMQQGMLFHALHDDDTGLYVNQLTADISGLDPERLRTAWQAVTDRHDVLRTGFVWRELSGSPQQVVYRRAEMRFIVEDWRERAAGMAPAALDEALNAVARRERADGFDLSRPPLQRLSLIRLDDDRHWLIWTHHHILMDGWSSARFMAEVMLLLEQGSLPAQKLRYRDYIAWLQTRDHDASSAFWRETLAELDEPSLLTSVGPGMVGHGSLTMAVDPDLSARLQHFATRERVTLNTVVQAAWAQLLRRQTGQDTVCFGVTVSDRPAGLAGAEEMIGLFINTLPVIDTRHPEQGVGAWLRDLQNRNLALREHGWMPLADIQRLAGRAGRALFDSILVFENYPVDQALKTKRGDLSASRTQILETSNYPLFISVGLDGELRLVFNFQRQYFDDVQIHRLQTAFVQLLAAVIGDADRKVGNVVAHAADDLAMLARVNATLQSAAFTSFVAQFETQVKRTPDAIALVHGDETISYGELNARANRLASRLKAHGIGADVVVGLALERSVTMMVALLAVLKAGGAYVPLDPDYPSERIAHMLRDSGAKLLLTQAELQDRFAPVLEATGAKAWLFDAEAGQGDGDAGNLDVEGHPESLAYVIYTSGSTGLPKGVMVRHGAVTNFLATMAEQPGLTREDRVLGLTSLSFDIAVLELWLPLTHGARIVLADRIAAHDPAVLKAIVARHGVTMIQATPSSWRMLLDHEETASWLPEHCRLLSGGEALAPDLARRLTALSGEVWNLYGPTETTVWSARHRLDTMDPRPVIGGPIGNTTLHVLDADLNLAPVGVVGELFIGGEGLARGYWRRAALSAERFIPDPFGPAGARLYRTGDLARWRADGVLDHVGRADHQVKIRGHRIELGEIEARLREQPGVRDSVVVAQELGGSRQLVGYVSGDDVDSAALRAALVLVLPDYMVPSRVMVLPQLPLTPNGKVDRKALPLPDTRPSETPRVAPRTPTEVALAAIWAELLHRDDVGVTDNFFELGGDSIISLQVVSRARRAGILLEPRDVFRHQTIELLASVSREAREDRPKAALTRGALAGLSDDELARLGLDWDLIEDIYPLSPMQQGMLFHSLRDAGSGVYVNQISVEIRGLDPERLRTAWQNVSARHPMLRTGFLWRELSGSPLQAVYHHASLPFEIDDWCGQAIDEAKLSAALAGERDAEFDLARPPLQRVRLLRIDDDCHRLIWTYHHILMDGWSSARFLGEVLESYAGRQLAPAPSHYRDYMAWLAAQDAGEAERFWRGQLAAFEQPTQLADAFGARRNDAHGHSRCYVRLEESATAALKAFARRERVTLNTLIQGVWALLLQRYTGQSTVTFGVTVAGRPASLDGAEQMIGLFINTLPMIETPPSAATIGDWLRAMQTRNAAIRNHEQTPLYDIQGWAGRAGEAMFDSIIVFENYPVDRGLVGDGSLSFSGLRHVDVTNYPMDLSVMVEDTLQVEFTYMPSHFTPDQAERIRAQFEHLLAALTRDAATVVGAIDAATSQDVARAQTCNSHAVSAVSVPLVHEAISQHAVIDPERIALTIGASSLSYGALERRANRLAHHLISLGLTPDQRVGVVVERTEATMLALLAVLKAGGAYVPLDPELPPERIAYVLQDSGAALLLSGARDVAAPDAVARIDLAGFDFETGPDHPPQPGLHPENLAYVIYTSGSTGRPKGVAVAHGPLAMHCHATAALYELDTQSCELHFLSLAFDGAHERWLTVLSQGARLVMRDAELWTPEQTVEAARAHGVTHLGLPPAYLQQVADWVEQTGHPPPVKLYSFGGEAMPKAGFDKVKRTLKPQILINGYGPTETVVTPLVWKVDGDADCDKAYAPIGVPVGNRSAYILDGQLNLVPAGAAGELYIGGVGLARGYHARAGLTGERFVPDPFSSAPGARLYRTGDLARWEADGVIEYLGRSDDQVKVSGFRIELGEIQSALLSEQAVAQAAVLAVPGAGGNQLIAYVAPKDARNAAGSAAERLSASLAASLRRSLPAYMVPARIVLLERLPTLSSGKVDRKALPAPEAAGARSFVAPESPAEIAMARLWGDVLGIPQVGVTDNFFELGGNSILSLKVIARLRREPILGTEIKLRDLLQKPTIRALLGTAASPAARPSALLPLNAPVAAGTEPVFCFHGGFGTVFDYAPLARRMEGHRQLIGLQCRSLIDPSFVDGSLTAMAADYVEEILKTQDHGPYHLIGWSLGGLIASLVAAELERRGYEVASLGLIDSFVPDPQRRAERQATQHWTDDLLGLLSVAAPGVEWATIRSQAAVLRDTGEPDTDAAIRSLIASVIGTTPVQSRDRLLGADEIVSAFNVGRQLARLAYAADWPADLAAEPACWWTSGRLAQRASLEARLTAAVDLGVIGDDHFSILADDAFLSSISSWLEPNGTAQAVPALQSEPAE
ncbi:putative Non-ribosomal peptide synthase:Amino acid adenylation (Modular protein) [Bradyrhizobium sp. ORS 285]|uniref:non-ribosomal peptide synthase/polyketide synthase n=1 Tax=Bradyrhizobium sp. ORS 285 TaxID=115808 RepID=UPI0002405163|nr:non-ribosomal peptide synthase/polyketide synthase [Bradyrhizobium sp. ORS 285]CCD85602.1 putative Non-ribosomal peptide synthase:Amino acid adenylation (modular protein) [Bradyrhizobium sp. ORS 285]SMX59877.1 putative Non-ribosomal peptide synthase:Amino acid adenylation (Modular protein) [Bradyrhizobium sp. ORS 285]